MGGVDLADMSRLHCNSTMIALQRWWLKLFFYNLDVGTANALLVVLFKKQATGQSDMNITMFKIEIVNSLVGHKLIEVVSTLQPSLVHSLERGEARNQCVYCNLF
jgi:hypothetical protein